jgi:hypothetical protein
MKSVKIIDCKSYLPNYEHLPNFYDFTGWFVLAKHNLIETDNAIFLQYDHVIYDANIVESTNSILKTNWMVGYVPAPYFMWTLTIQGFYEKQVAGLASCGVDWPKLVSEKPFETWPSTQGTAWRTEEFTKFMLWFEPAFNTFANDTFAGHLAERMIQPFLMAHNQEAGYFHGAVGHESKDCHGTGDLMRGNLESFSAKNSVFGR